MMDAGNVTRGIVPRARCMNNVAGVYRGDLLDPLMMATVSRGLIGHPGSMLYMRGLEDREENEE